MWCMLLGSLGAASFAQRGQANDVWAAAACLLVHTMSHDATENPTCSVSP